jgi:hypothetical protein
MLAETTRRYMSAIVVATGAGVAIYLAEPRQPDEHYWVPLDEPIQLWRWGSCELVADPNQRALPWQSCGQHGCRELVLDPSSDVQPWEPQAAFDGDVPVIGLRIGADHVVIRGERRMMSVRETDSCAFAWLKLVPMWRAIGIGPDSGYMISVERAGAVTGEEIDDFLKLDLGIHHDSPCYASGSDLIEADRPWRSLDVPALGPGEELHPLVNTCSAAVMLVVEPEFRGSGAYYAHIKRVVYAPAIR